MKKQTTIKFIRNNWKKKFFCGYCELSYIMEGCEADYYNCGVYGWNCDIYCDFKRDIAICTGYRNMVGERIPNEIIEKYSNKAKDILESKKSYNEVKEELEANRVRFFQELDKI